MRRFLEKGTRASFDVFITTEISSICSMLGFLLEVNLLFLLELHETKTF